MAKKKKPRNQVLIKPFANIFNNPKISFLTQAFLFMADRVQNLFIFYREILKNFLTGSASEKMGLNSNKYCSNKKKGVIIIHRNYLYLL